MNILIRNITLLVFAWLMLTGISFAKLVHLQNGDVVECQSFWQRGDSVFVKINRDTVIEFDKSEIDGRRSSLPAERKAPRLRHTKAHSSAAPERTVNAVAVPAPVQPAAPAVKPPPSTPLPAAKEDTAKAEPPQPDRADPTSPSDKAELERRTRQAAEMMAEAIQKRDPELMKKAIEAQKEVIEARKSAVQRPGVQPAIWGPRYLLLLLVVCLLIIASMWVIFEKTGHSGWECLLPIYNMYVLLSISGKPAWWLIPLCIPVVGVVFYLLAMLSLAERFDRGALFGIGLFLLPMIFFPLLAFGGSRSHA